MKIINTQHPAYITYANTVRTLSVNEALADELWGILFLNDWNEAFDSNPNLKLHVFGVQTKDLYSTQPVYELGGKFFAYGDYPMNPIIDEFDSLAAAKDIAFVSDYVYTDGCEWNKFNQEWWKDGQWMVRVQS